MTHASAASTRPRPTGKKKPRLPLLTILAFSGCFCLVGLGVSYDMAGVAPFNVAVGSAVASLRGDLDGVMAFFTAIGDPPGMLLIALAFAAVLLAQGHGRDAAFFCVAVVSGVVFAHLLKLFFAVERPAASYLVAPPEPFSFPSGHAVASAIVFGLVGYFVCRLVADAGKPRAWGVAACAVCAACALLIALSRVYMGVHWPTDVLGGWLFAGAWLALSIGVHRRLFARRTA